MRTTFYVFPRLYTDDLILRNLTADDISSFIKYGNNKKITDQILNMPFPFREPDAVFKIGRVQRAFKDGSSFIFSIIHKDSSEMIGEIAIHLLGNEKGEIAYWIGEPFWGRGWMTEVIKKVIDFSRDKLELKELFASTFQDNFASQRVLQKNGFTPLTTSNRLLEFRMVLL